MNEWIFSPTLHRIIFESRHFNWKSVSGEMEAGKMIRRNTELFSLKKKREANWGKMQECTGAFLQEIRGCITRILPFRLETLTSPTARTVYWWLTNKFFLGTCPWSKRAISSKVMFPAAAAQTQRLVKTRVHSLVLCLNPTYIPASEISTGSLWQLLCSSTSFCLCQSCFPRSITSVAAVNTLN